MRFVLNCNRDCLIPFDVWIKVHLKAIQDGSEIADLIRPTIHNSTQKTSYDDSGLKRHKTMHTNRND